MRYDLARRAAAVSLLTIAPAAAELRPGDTVSFVTCPIAQDRGPETDLCFFVEHGGERFSVLTQAFDSTGPMLRHKMLVEGTVIAGERECGGLRLQGVTSALPEITLECNEVRPFEPKFAPIRAANPTRDAELQQRLRADPALSVQPIPFDFPPRTGPAPREWEMLYTFDSDRGDGPALELLVALVQAATRERAATIRVHGYRGASRLDTGEVMSEPAGIAEQRAKKIAHIIAGLGFPEANLEIRWTEETATPDGRTDWRTRRVTVRVEE